MGDREENADLQAVLQQARDFAAEAQQALADVNAAREAVAEARDEANLCRREADDARQEARDAQNQAVGATQAAINAQNNQPRSQLLTSVDEFHGRDDENFSHFANALSSSLILAGVPNNQRYNYLRLRLKGSALLFFERLAPNIRTDYDQAIIHLRRHYENDDKREVKGIEFDARSYKEGKETPAEFLDDLRVLAHRSFPEPEREARVRDRLIKGMPAKFRKKLLNAAPALDADQLVNLLNKKIAIDKACNADESLSAFSEINISLQSKVNEALEELTKTQKDLKQTQEALVQKSNTMDVQNFAQIDQIAPINMQPRPQHFQNQNYRGGFRGGRGGPFNRGQGRRWPQMFPPQFMFPPAQFGYPGYGFQAPGPQNFTSYQRQNFNNGQNQNFGQNFQSPMPNGFRPRGPRPPRGNGNQYNGNQIRSSNPNIQCYNCGEIGHTQSQCPTRQPAQRGAQIPYEQMPKN